jgi:hypothetical protein
VVHSNISPITRQILPWRRFWLPLGGALHCGDDGSGFLTDPEDRYGKHANPKVSRLVDLLAETGPIVLCGEPGIGKSTELASIRASLETEATAAGGSCCWLIFREIADLAEFRRLTVESASWQTWRAGTTRLTLVVDGVDEGLLRVPNFLNDLTALLRDEHLNRLRVVLACRSAEWPLEMGRRLLGLWPTRATESLYELCPLRRKDAEDAARALGCDPDAFLRAVWERSAVVLAARPITLFFLLDEYRRHAGLPATHRELYERGTANLVCEVDPARLELLRALRKTEARVSDGDRLHAAQRLAALLLLSGRSAVRVSGGAFTAVHDHDLLLETAAGAGPLPVTVAALEEAVESALFTSLGERRFGFVHQTFAECLAAQHLRSLPLVQIRRLLCQRDVRGEHVIPQLAELAAWVAGGNSAFCEYLLRIEPEILLRSDITRLQGTLKSRLVEAVLAGARQEKIFDDIGFGRFLAGLNHQGLSEQLRPLICDRQGHYIARRIAISIAGSCHCVDLINPLLALVMDNTDVAHLRDRAASALEDIVPDDQLALLEPLARGEAAPDSDDSIKGYALRRLVPKHWKVRDALPYLTPRKNDRFMGAYEMFLRYDLPKALEEDDLPLVLAWLRPKKDCLSSLMSFHQLAPVVFAKALRLLHVPMIAAEVSENLQVWITRHDLHHLPHNSEIRKVLAEDESVCRQLVALYLNHPNTKPNDVFGLMLPLPLLRGAQSLDWLLDHIPQAPAERRANWTAAIAHLTTNAEEAAQCWDKLLLRIGEIPELATQFEWLRAWDLNEKRARDAKARWLRNKRREAENARYMREFTAADPKPKIESALTRFSEGDQRAWMQLWYQLILGKNGDEEHIFTCDVAACPNWELLSPEQRQAAPAIARAFLLSDAKNDDHSNKLDAVHLAAASAIWMLREALETDMELQAAVVDHWLGTMVWHVDTHSEPRRALFRLAYTMAPDATRTELIREAKNDESKHRYPFAFRVAKDCWDSTLSAVVVQLIESSVDPLFVLNGLNDLAARDRAAALDYATRLLGSVAPGSLVYPIHIFGALVAGLSCGADRIWTLAEPVLTADDELARLVVAKVCYGFDMDQRGLLKDLAEPALGSFYLLLRRLYPPSSDPPRGGSSFVSAADCARRTRGQLPGMIAGRGTEAACRELLRLAAALPEEATWLRWSHREAVTTVRRNLWQPPSPENVKSVLERPQARMLTCDDDLLEVVLESLARLQTRLTGQALPSAEELWLWDGGGLNRKSFRPKDEEALSDYIARWLAEDIGPRAGVVVNREVQPRRGARTDVIVEATIPGAETDFDKLTVVIEVKGCWHNAARTGLRSQLVDGYLRVHGWRCGIYLVGWFVCPQWQHPENRLKSDTATDAVTELAELATEFDGVTSEFRVGTCLLDCTLPPMKSPSG